MSVAFASTIPAIWPRAFEKEIALRDLAARFFAWFGGLAIFCARVVRALFTTPFEGRELLRQMDVIGAQSLLLVTLAGAATGVVMALQTHDSLTRFGAKAMLPSVIVFAILRETGSIITGLVVSGRVAAGIGSELGSMKVTEQIDAMEASAVDPYNFLAATRILACMAMLPLLTLAADFGGVVMGWVATNAADRISFAHFINTGFRGLRFSDFLAPIAKTCFFGAIMGVISCFQGMRTRGGTEGVGRSATSSVVLSSLSIILADVILVKLTIILFP